MARFSGSLVVASQIDMFLSFVLEGWPLTRPAGATRRNKDRAGDGSPLRARQEAQSCGMRRRVADAMLREGSRRRHGTGWATAGTRVRGWRRPRTMWAQGQECEEPTPAAVGLDREQHV